MKNKNGILSFFAGIVKNAKSTAVNSSRILMLLLITVAFLLPLHGQNMTKQTTLKSEAFERIIIVNGEIFISAAADFSDFAGKTPPSGTRVCSIDTLTGITRILPVGFEGSSQLMPYKEKLFFVKDFIQIWSYDTLSNVFDLLFTANDTIVNFWNISDGKILVNARTGGTATIGLTTNSVQRLVVVDYKNEEVQNVTDEPYIFQAFTCGEDWVVYLEGPKNFGPYPGKFRTTVKNIKTGVTFSRSDFVANWLAIPRDDSTFLAWNEYSGPNKISLVNVNSIKNVPNDTFFMDHIWDVGAAGWAPPIIAFVNGGGYLKSSIPYLPDREKQFSEIKNLKTGITYKAPDDEVWVYNIDDFSVRKVGKFVDTLRKQPIYSVTRIGGRFVAINLDRLMTTSLFGKTTRVNSLQASGLNVYPNPTTDGAINLSMPSAGKIEVCAVTGQLQFSQNIEAGYTRLENAMTLPGVYCVRVTIGNQSQTFQVLRN